MQPHRPNKAEVARALARYHFGIEDGLERVLIIHAGIDDPSEPIKLLEVNANTFSTGSIEPIPFSPAEGVPFVTELPTGGFAGPCRMKRGAVREEAVIAPRTARHWCMQPVTEFVPEPCEHPALSPRAARLRSTLPRVRRRRAPRGCRQEP